MVVEGLEKRMPFRRVMKSTLEKVMANRDVLGVRILCSGRLGGATMSRSEDRNAGPIPSKLSVLMLTMPAFALVCLTVRSA